MLDTAATVKHLGHPAPGLPLPHDQVWHSFKAAGFCPNTLRDEALQYLHHRHARHTQPGDVTASLQAELPRAQPPPLPPPNPPATQPRGTTNPSGTSGHTSTYPGGYG